MEIFEFIRCRLIDEEARHPSGSADCIVGTALCRAVRHELREETRRRKGGSPSRSDPELIEAVTTFLEQNWTTELQRAEDAVRARSIDLLDDRLAKSIDFALQDVRRREHPIWFATWTGVLANTVWLVLGAAIILLAMLMLGESPEDAVRALLLPDG